MSTSPEAAIGLDHFFSAVAARHDRWRDLAKAAQAWMAKGAGSPLKAECARRLEHLKPFESLQAFPGMRLVRAIEERIGSGDAQGALRLVQRVSGALMTRGYRSEAGEWEGDEEGAIGERVMPTAARETSARPYFEALFVTPSPPSRWNAQIQQIRKLRRPQDEFVYEPVMVGSFEDALSR
jgi:arginine decarboxylase